jgi:hypothetical protein
MTSDGSHIRVTCVKHSTVVELRINDGSLVGVYPVPKDLMQSYLTG